MAYGEVLKLHEILEKREKRVKNQELQGQRYLDEAHAREYLMGQYEARRRKVGGVREVDYKLAHINDDDLSIATQIEYAHELRGYADQLMKEATRKGNIYEAVEAMHVYTKVGFNGRQARGKVLRAVRAFVEKQGIQPNQQELRQITDFLNGKAAKGDSDDLENNPLANPQKRLEELVEAAILGLGCTSMIASIMIILGNITGNVIGRGAQTYSSNILGAALFFLGIAGILTYGKMKRIRN